MALLHWLKTMKHRMRAISTLFAFHSAFRRQEKPLKSAIIATLSVKQDLHPPLRDCGREIRLVNILPADKDETLQITCRVVPFVKDQRVAYICLSYAWKKEEGFESVLFEGHQLQVTRNLHTMLSRLRRENIAINIWIDALCINQDDKAEKSRQVSMMAEIFSRAEKVYIGVDDGGDGKQCSGADDATVRDTIQQLASDKHLPEVDCFSSESSRGPDARAALQGLLQAKWFTRTWTVQEFCRAQKAVLLSSCGLIEWNDLACALINWNAHRTWKGCCSAFTDTLDEEVGAALHKIYTHCLSLQDAVSSSCRHMHIIQLIMLFQHLEAEDPKDKLYALQSLHAGEGLAPQDYCKTVEAVFTIFALWTFSTLTSAYILGLDLRMQGSALPSWVPDLSLPPPMESNIWRRRQRFLDQYNASEQLSWAMPTVSHRRLCLAGAVVDAVDDVSAEVFSYRENADHAKLLHEWYRFFRGDHHDEAHGIADWWEDSFCWLMLGGCIEEEEEVRKARTDDFARFRATITRMEQHPTEDAAVSHDATVAAQVTATHGRRLFRTCKGLMGLGPENMQHGDAVCVLAGARAPFILRKADIPPHGCRQYRVVAHCFVDGMMNGEANTGVDLGDRLVLV